MPTSKKRLSITLPEDIEMWLMKWAALNRREIANAVVQILGERMNEDIRMVDSFRPPRLAEPERDRTPVYEIRPASPSVVQGKAGPKPDQEGR